jgi:transcriptional regulator with XRE-family HTH domain
LSDEINYTALGERIRGFREKAKMTQEKLSEICNLSAAHIGHIERGTRIPSLDTMFKIATTLNISIDVLLMDSYAEDEKNLCSLTDIVNNKRKLNLKYLVSNVKILIDEIDRKI